MNGLFNNLKISLSHARTPYLQAHPPATQKHSPHFHTLVDCHSHPPPRLESPWVDPPLCDRYPSPAQRGCTETEPTQVQE